MTFEPKRTAVSAGEMAYVDLGEGPPVVLLHGFPTSSFLWRREVPLMASRMRVIAPDLLGFGDSDKPAQAGYVRELLESLGVERFAAVGHDLGGGIAQVLALDGVGVATMVLLNAACFDAWPIEGVRMIQSAGGEAETAGFVEDVLRLTFDLGVKHRADLSEQDVRAYARPWVADPPAFFRAARAIDGKGLAGREAELSALNVPAMILWGEDDPFLPSELAERLGEVLGSTVALLPGCGHFVSDDAPSTVPPLVFEFLRSQYLGDRPRHGGGPVRVSLERPEDGGFPPDDPGE